MVGLIPDVKIIVFKGKDKLDNINSDSPVPSAFIIKEHPSEKVLDLI